MFEKANIYCERISCAFWAEPVNAWTNACFLVAAAYVWYRAHRRGVHDSGVSLLITLMCAIGIGSFLWHTFAEQWARWADVLPILLFQLLYAWIYFRKVVQMPRVCALAVVVAYGGAAVLCRQFPKLVNGSLTYAPAWVFVLGLGIYHAVTHRKKRGVVLAAAGVFSVSLVFRTVDNAVCPSFPLGTHFMWHVCNALALCLLMDGLAANLPAPSTTQRRRDG